ncbi:MAG: hypothetical protein ACYCVY_09840 [Acidiferrobacteraceae bacterium]
MSTARPITIVKASVSIRVRVSLSLVRDRLGDFAANAGSAAAERIHDIVLKERLGYCPALNFFADHPGIEPGVIAAVEEAGLFVSDYVAKETRNHLWSAFSHIKIQRVQIMALTLPNVRPGQPEALTVLARHYTPTEINLILILSSLQRGPAVENQSRLIAQKVMWWLRDTFESVELKDTRLVDA